MPIYLHIVCGWLCATAAQLGGRDEDCAKLKIFATWLLRRKLPDPEPDDPAVQMRQTGDEQERGRE